MLSIRIDKLTRSIEEVATGRSLDTQIERASEADIAALDPGWQFDWMREYRTAEVYKLTVSEHGPLVHGLLSLTRKPDHVYAGLLESHPRNVGRGKEYAGVAGNLMAFAARLSFRLGHDGYVAFDAKTALISHYERTLGACRIGSSQRMFLDTDVAERLVTRYFGAF